MSRWADEHISRWTDADANVDDELDVYADANTDADALIFLNPLITLYSRIVQWKSRSSMKILGELHIDTKWVQCQAIYSMQTQSMTITKDI